MTLHDLTQGHTPVILDNMDQIIWDLCFSANAIPPPILCYTQPVYFNTHIGKLPFSTPVTMETRSSHTAQGLSSSFNVNYAIT